MYSCSSTPTPSSDTFLVCVSTPESAPAQEGCAPGASPYPNPFTQVSEFSDAVRVGVPGHAHGTEMSPANQQARHSEAPLTPYPSHMAFDPSYFMVTSRDIYISRPGGGSMALSPHLMQATLFGRYHAAPTNTSMIPSSRPDSVESYGVYGPFYGYQHTYGFSPFDPRMTRDAHFPVDITSISTAGFSRYPQEGAETMRMARDAGATASTPRTFAAHLQPSHPYLHPFDAAYADSSGGSHLHQPRIAKSSTIRFLEEECTVSALDPSVCLPTDSDTCIRCQQGQKHVSNSLRRVTPALADRVQSNLPVLMSIASSHDLRAKLLRAGHSEDTVSKWLKAIHQKPGKYSAQLPEVVVGAWIHKKCQDCVSLLLRTIADGVTDGPESAGSTRKRQRSTYTDSKAEGLETTFNTVYSDPGTTTAHV